jgi:hypothetical protein
VKGDCLLDALPTSYRTQLISGPLLDKSYLDILSDSTIHMLVLRLELTQLVALRSAPLDFLQNNLSAWHLLVHQVHR